MPDTRQAIAIAANKFQKISKLFLQYSLLILIVVKWFLITVLLYNQMHFESGNKANLSKIKNVTWFKTPG